ncbi:MAG: hypothetical protein OEX03_13530, partial [Gammaproteobacteria bacterium]|nr:hypothetical protein [Gammaproteobacteria bacterium]
MSDFHPVYPDNVGLDPYKRVRYTEGMVLGIDEFLQEELYLLGKHQLHNRGLHGYGTVCGLKVNSEAKGADSELKVAPGIAIDPQGREIRVPEAQCASINTWLNNNKQKILDRLGLPPVLPAVIPVYLKLCYRECETDLAPVPSGPCLSLDKTQIPTRIADDYELVLSLEPPSQVEEDALRLFQQSFMQLIASINVNNTPGGLSLANIECLVRNLLEPESPLVCEPPLGAMRIRPQDVEPYLRAAMRIWVTEIRPALIDTQRNCANGLVDEACVLLAQINMQVDKVGSNLRVDNASVEVDEYERPFLLHTRLMQEQWLQGLVNMPSGGGAPPPPIDESNIMHLIGDETVEGNKTFTDPIKLGADGRVTRRIMLPPMLGMPTSTADKAIHDTYRARTPSIRFLHQGEASFTVPVPDDMEFDSVARCRVVWGVKANQASVVLSWEV